MVDDSKPTTAEKIRRALADLHAEYSDPHHSHPWIIGYSGGKDSTLVLQLAIEAVLDLPPEHRTREIHVLSNDTLVESPVIASYVDAMLAQIGDATKALRLPITVVKTTPDLDHTFWVNLIGRGYPPPNRMFRWCTDRMKIRPTSNYIQQITSACGSSILLLGVRRAESATRAASVDRYTPADGGRLNPHNDLKGCMVFRPIVDFTTDEVWQTLMQRRPPWGGTHRQLITLYRNAQGGECPLVMDANDAPSCGSSSSRFGCWTCTVVDKDRSMEGFVDSGYDHLEPLLEFRDWLATIRGNRDMRMKERRNGQVTLMSDGTAIPGPFTSNAREAILSRLLQTQDAVGVQLISPEEIARIKAIWAQDLCDRATRALKALSRGEDE
jgi:DNA sulfur modification protein DndC